MANGKLTWLGHGTFRLDTAGGKVVLVDPWLEGNPKAPANAEPERLDLILVTHAHFDHLADAARLAHKRLPRLVDAGRRVRRRAGRLRSAPGERPHDLLLG